MNITFLGEPCTVKRISAKGLFRIAGGLYELIKMSQVDMKRLTDLSPNDYPQLILLALDSVLLNIGKSQEMTRAEEIVFSALGALVDRSADDVAESPLDDLQGLLMAIWRNEQETQLGKSLIRILQQFEAQNTKDTEPSKTFESHSDTTSPKSKKKLAGIGTAALGG